MTIHSIGQSLLGMSPQQSFLFFASIAGTLYSVPRFYRRLKHKKSVGTATGQHNMAFTLALVAWIALCINFPFHLVQTEDTFDWVSACVILVGTCWVAIGAVMTRQEEREMLALLTPPPGGTPPTAIEKATVAALVNASKYCRNGLIVIVLGTVIQMGHLVDKAHQDVFAFVTHSQAQAQAGAPQ